MFLFQVSFYPSVNNSGFSDTFELVDRQIGDSSRFTVVANSPEEKKAFIDDTKQAVKSYCSGGNCRSDFNRIRSVAIDQIQQLIQQPVQFICKYSQTAVRKCWNHL